MYCVKCGNTGKLINGEICDCRKTINDVYADVSCMEIPEQYRDVMFNEGLVPKLQSDRYSKELAEIHTKISTLEWKNKNYLLCSPPRSSKTIMAYSCIRRLFKAGIQITPIFDVLEIRKMLKDYDMGIGDREQTEALIQAPYAFIRIPQALSTEVFQTAVLILDRRVRRGGSTIFLYNGSWYNIEKADTFRNFTPYQGDGAYSSYLVSSWKGVNEA